LATRCYAFSTAGTKGTLALFFDGVISVLRQWIFRSGSWKLVAGGCRMRRVQNDHPVNVFRMMPGNFPRYDPSPVVTRDTDALAPKCIGNGKEHPQ
jgi:hypothetical protein